MLYRYEIHCHTKNTSRCGKTDALEVVRLYREAGYDGVVITDHYSPMTFGSMMPFYKKKAIDCYLSGYRKALTLADDQFSVLLGMELRFYATVNDYLVYGLNEEMLYRWPNLMPLYLRRASRLLHKDGLLVIQAHPFRPFITRANPKYLDGVEIYNGKTSRELNEKAADWAEKTGARILTGGSDFHSVGHLARSGIQTEEKIRNNADLIRILNSGNFEIIRNAY